jgi:outer membrane receptor protein involved in Fe transport
MSRKGRQISRFLIFTFLIFRLSDVSAQTTEQWQFTLTPILWNASVSASLSDDNSGGELPITPEYSFFTLDNLDDYLSLKFEARHGRYSILFDSLRARYADEIVRNITDINIGTELGFAELLAGYQLSEKYRVELIGGVRYSFLDVDMQFDPGPGTERSFNWTDPVIGLRYNHPLSDNWQLWLRADLGGFDVSTQRMINATADVQYMFNDYVSMTVGYRYLQIDFKEDDFLYDVNLKGAYLGLGIHF